MISENVDSVDCMFHLEDDASNISMSNIVMIHTRCRTAAMSINRVKGFHISSLHIGNIGIVNDGHGLL